MTWSRWKKTEPTPIPESMIEKRTTLPNGATFTKLKPAAAEGAEDQEFWKQCGKSLRGNPRVLR